MKTQSGRVVRHARAVRDRGRWLTPSDAGLALEPSAFGDGGGKLEIELVAWAIVRGCQAQRRSCWHWFTEAQLRQWFREAKLPWTWLAHAFECRMIGRVVRRRCPNKRLFAVTRQFVLHWLRHLQER